MDAVAGLTCAVCGAYGVQVHHIRAGQGMSQRASDFLTVPLCVDCHTGKGGIHGDRSMMRIRGLSEIDLVADTIRRVFEGRQ